MLVKSSSWRQSAALKRRSVSRRLHCIASQKAVIFVISVVRTWKRTQFVCWNYNCDRDFLQNVSGNCQTVSKTCIRTLSCSFHPLWKVNKRCAWLETKKQYICTVRDSCTQHIRFKRGILTWTCLCMPHSAVFPFWTLPLLWLVEYISYDVSLLILCHLHSDPNPVTRFEDVLLQKKLNLTFKITLLKMHGLSCVAAGLCLVYVNKYGHTRYNRKDSSEKY